MPEQRAAVTSGGPAPTGGHAGDRLFILTAVIALSLFAVVNALSEVHDRHIALWEPLVWETTSILVIIALLPLFMAFTRRVWPLDSPLWRSLGLHALALAAFSVTHVAAMGALRSAVYALVGGSYAALAPLGDFLYEFRKDALAYAGFVFLYVTWRLLWARQAPAPPMAGDPALEVRDGARRYFVPLTDIAWIEAAGNYVELHRGPTPILHRGPLSEMERQLKDQGFVRIHRSRLVRRGAIAAVVSKPSGDYLVQLADGRELAGSRRYRRPLLEP
jgi:hypothetical protein